ncbi:MAG: hypothetical protein A3G75_11740 [Verrucomicrobia bacterium RIFCSPLOWO2_12_FULL_64_8]|nr:MAG: hypothetical protein A3G75_11740 [Verrucomicrobia bacterium RIFCSPLOWO2_12_FULL_64_8]
MGAALGVMIVVLFAATILGVIYARGARLAAVPAGTFVHVCMRANVSFVGLPVIFYLVAGRPDAAALRAKAFLIIAPFILIQTVIGLIALLAPQHRPGLGMVRTIGREIITNPILLSTALGGVVAWAGWKLPAALTRSLDPLGAIASPLALLAIGAALLTVPIRGNRTTALVASATKVGIMPALGWALGRWAGLGDGTMMVMLVYLACPTGPSSFSLVTEMGGDESIASTTIVLSTLLSAIPLAVIAAAF